MTDRQYIMKQWLNDLGYDLTTLQTASEDASFRRYFRIQKAGKSYIVMDAPPQHESCKPFVDLATRLTGHHVNAPHIFAQNIKDGFLILSDFGDDVLLGILQSDTVEQLYGDAMDTILTMQKNMPTCEIPLYSAQLLEAEMDLFRQWFMEQLLGLTLDSHQRELWQQVKTRLINNALEQPQTFVHRDFHSRNLIKTDQGSIGVIDFQDAVKGAMTYDVVSLLRDCYIAWPEHDVMRWLAWFHQQAVQQGLLDVSLAQCTVWFNLMGVQRHLKAIGIFSRLKLRDNKQGYIADIPRTLAYIQAVSQQESGLEPLKRLLGELSLDERVHALRLN